MKLFSLQLQQVFEVGPSLYVVELRKSYGDASVYRQVCILLLSLSMHSF